MQEMNRGQLAEIKMETTIAQNNEIYRHSFEEMGRVLELNGHYYIRFEEKNGDEPVSVTVKIAREGYVQLIRNGEVITRLVFNREYPQEFSYQTPAGNLGMLVHTESLAISLKNQPFAGKVAIDYSIMSGENKLGDYQLRLQFTT